MRLFLWFSNTVMCGMHRESKNYCMFFVAVLQFVVILSEKQCLQILISWFMLGTFPAFCTWFTTQMGKSRDAAASVLANLMDYSIATSDSEIIFLLIGKAIHEPRCTVVISTANNNLRSAAMDICSSVTRCFTLLKLDTHSKVLASLEERCD